MTSQNSSFMTSQSKPNYMINSTPQQQPSFMTSQQSPFGGMTSSNGNSAFGGNNMMTSSVFGGSQMTGNNSTFGSMTSYSNQPMMSQQTTTSRNKGDMTSLDSLLSFPSQQKGKPMSMMTSQAKVNTPMQNNQQKKLTQQDLLEFLG